MKGSGLIELVAFVDFMARSFLVRRTSSLVNFIGSFRGLCMITLMVRSSWPFGGLLSAQCRLLGSTWVLNNFLFT
jgi:hypothetical protein